MLYFDSCLKIPGKTACYLPGDPILAERGLYKDPRCYDKEQQGQEEPQQYFLEFPQVQQFKL